MQPAKVLLLESVAAQAAAARNALVGAGYRLVISRFESDGLLKIKGQKKADREEKKKDYYVRECRYGSFSRSFRVPDSVLEDEITADLEKGVLSVTLPKRAIAKRGPKSIKVSKGL